MSKITWSDVIASIDLSDKTVRNPRKLSQDEIADIKVKCNPKYDLTIMDLVCTIEALQQENEQLKANVSKWQKAYEDQHNAQLHCTKRLGKVYTVLVKARDVLATTIKGIDNKKIIPANADAAIELWIHKQQIQDVLAEIEKA
jgi:FtsZ-binding cell division protein ZapB